MKLDIILKTINKVSYENVADTIVPVKDLSKLRTEILKLQEQLRQEQIGHRKTRSEALKIMAEAEPMILRLDTYA